MRNFRKILVFLCTVTFFTSCEDELLTKETETIDKKAEVLSGENMLSFETMEEFKKAIMEVKDLTDEEILARNQNLQFTSLHSKYLEALTAEQRLVNRHKSFIDKMMVMDSTEKIETFKREYSEDIAAFKQSIQEMYSRYGKFVVFENNRVAGIKIYDPIMAALVNEYGLVRVEGTILQYTDTQLKVLVQQEEGINIKLLLNSSESNAEKGIFIRSLAPEKQASLRTSEDKHFKDNCSAQFYTNFKMTGNTTVTNTVVPIYRNEWVPKVCKIVCLDGKELPVTNNSTSRIRPDDCFEQCTGGYYKKVLVGYDVLNTRINVTIRNYKINCVIGCWETWFKQDSEITLSGAYSKVLRPGRVEKYTWAQDIPTQSSGTLDVTYRSEYTFLVFGTCPTRVTWNL